MTSNPELIPPLTDFTLSPEPHSPPAGDWKDDDGLAIDSYFRAMDLGPLVSVLVEAVKRSIPAGLGTTEKPLGNRLLRANYVLTPGQPAVQVFPEDPNRLHLIIRELDATGFYFSDTYFVPVDDISTSANHQTNAYFVGANANGQVAAITLDDYTGPLFVSGRATGGGTSIMEIMAITS